MTTSVSSSTSSSTATTTSATDAAAAANKAAAQALIDSLSAGSGVDVSSLATNLVAAAKAPQANIINAKITTAQSRISGYSAVSYALSEVQTALANLKDKTDFNSLTATSSSTAFTATATTSAAAGSHDVDVLSLAKAQRTVSGSFAAATTSLNSGNAMSFALTVGSGSTATTSYVSVAAGSDTPRGLVDAINSANTGVTASLVNTGDATNPYKIVMIGSTGASNSFSLKPVSTLGTFAVAHGASVNNGTAMNFQVTVNGTTTTLSSVSDTPDAIAAAINGATDANGNSLGLTASVISGTTTSTASGATSTVTSRIVISGPSGGYSISDSTDGGTTYATAVSDTGTNGTISSTLGLANNQTATNASIKVDGVSYTRSTNSFNDVLTGVTFNLQGLTTTGATDSSGNPVSNTASLNLTRDTSSIQTNFSSLVSAYNDAVNIMGEVMDPKSTLETYGGTLSGDSTVRLLQSQLRDMLTDNSSTPGTSIGALWQLGVSIDSSGTMSLDTTALTSALSDNYDDVVTTLTGNQNNLTTTSTTAGGVAGDAWKKISTILSSTGVIQTQSNNAETQITKYDDQLTQLDTRMDALLTRYQTQFSTMNSLVGTINSEKSSLKTTFAGMMSMYTGSSS